MKKNKTTKGFILMEAIIAVAVLITIFVAAISLHTSAVMGIRTTNNQLIATFLAQDAMEHVVAKRQYNFEYDLSWLDGMLDGTNNCTNANPCSADFDDDITQPFNNCGSACDLMLSGNEYKLDDTTGTNTLFSRSVEISTLNTFEAQVIVRVKWQDGSNTNEYKLIHILYNDPN